MAVEKITCHPDTGGTKIGERDATASVSYRVVLDSATASDWEALLAIPVVKGDPYDHHGAYIPWLRASGADADREDGRVWRVDVSYKTYDPDRSDDDNPLNDPPEIGINYEQVDKRPRRPATARSAGAARP